MNKEIRQILENNNINIKKITLKGNVKIIESNDDRYVIKRKKDSLSSLFKYLSSRSFENYPRKLFESINYDVYEYIEDIEQPFEQKILDIVKLVSVLHSKTTFYKTIDSDEYKDLYESIVNRIDYLYDYYNNIVVLFEKEEFMSPAVYLMLRNISLVFQTLNFCKTNINKWYEIINEKKRVRIVQLHNNLNVDHYMKNKYSYFISWEKSKRDLPIYDLLHLFDLYYYQVDIIHIYEMNYPLLEEEKNLLFVMISLPDKIIFDDQEYLQTIKVKRFYDKLKSANIVVSDYMSKEKKVSH